MAVGTMTEAPAARRSTADVEEAVDMDEFCEQQAAATGEGATRQTRSVKVAAVLLACMVGVALVAAAGVDQTARPRPESELLSKADDALQGGRLHALATALTRRNKILAARRAEQGTGSAHAAMAAQAHVQRSASKLATAPKTMTRGKMLDEEPAAAEEPAADEAPADDAGSEEPSIEGAPGEKPEGIIKGDSDSAMESEIGNLKPTGIMGVFFSGHTFVIAVGIIISLIVGICLFATYCDCALT
jgi:hypothetical protein